MFKTNSVSKSLCSFLKFSNYYRIFFISFHSDSTRVFLWEKYLRLKNSEGLMAFLGQAICSTHFSEA